MRILFVRHGESVANVDRIFSNRSIVHPLTTKGREQVLALAEKLKYQGITTIFSSSICRAVESAEILSEQLGVPRSIEPALAEWDVGIYEGRPLDEGWQDYLAVEKKWTSGELNAKISGGESCNEIRARFVPFIQRLIKQFSDRDDAAILLVGHGGTYRHALPVVLANVSCEYAMAHGLANTAYVEAKWRDGALHCVRWCDEVFNGSAAD